MLTKLVVGLAQSDKKYGLSKNNNLEEVINLFSNNNIKNLDTSLEYKNSHILLENINLKSYKLSIKLPKISNRKNLRSNIITLIEDIFKKYKIKHFETLLLHDPLLPLEKEWESIYKLLLNYKKRKKIKKIGVSVYNKFELENILKVFKPDLVQFPYNIFNQNFDNIYLKSLKKKGIELHARSIFLQGLLLLKNDKIPKFFSIWDNHLKKYINILKNNNISSVDFNLNFAFRNRFIDKVIIGFSDKNQFKSVLDKIKNFKNNNKFDKYYQDLDIDDKLINDPRFWPKSKNKKIKKYKTYEKWIKNKNVVNGGVGLLSKRPDQFLPVGWPTYYTKAKNCFIWGSEGQKFIDFSLMGVGTNILGYSDSEINKVAIQKIEESNSSTLVSEEEKMLAEELISAHPWSGKTIFARSGAEANTIALRVARLNNDKKGVAVCGYHGWHDWYLAANFKKDKIKYIHLEGLATDGIPDDLGKYVYPFKFNDLGSFKEIIKKHKNVGIVFMEVERNLKLKIKFLKGIKKICEEKNLILIFDECSSGFRETYGGLHLKYKIDPDIAVFGKSIANGIPLTVVIGSKNIMDKASKSFISSTFWSDTMAPAVGLATLKKMKKIKSWKKITKTGKIIKKKWKQLARKYKLKIIVSGIDAMPTFQFKSKKNWYYRNYLVQEFLKNKILATNTVYCCVHHEKYLNIYFKILEKIFFEISKFEKNLNVSDFLEYPTANQGFERLN